MEINLLREGSWEGQEETKVKQSIPEIKGVSVMEASEGAQVKRTMYREWGFRIVDLVIGSVGLVVAMPVLTVIFLLIKWENPRSAAIFKQLRVKKDGQPFYMYKFRSMEVGAETQQAKLGKQNEMQGPMFKIANDPRITKIGRFIRKTSIDEFPQLWNVIKGDMSIVGPRPPLPVEVAEYTQRDWKRLAIKPGCTGLWQVSGRNKLGFREMIRLDLLYIEQRSIRLNMMIIFKTFKELTIWGGGM